MFEFIPGLWLAPHQVQDITVAEARVHVQYTVAAGVNGGIRLAGKIYTFPDNAAARAWVYNATQELRKKYSATEVVTHNHFNA